MCKNFVKILLLITIVGISSLHAQENGYEELFSVSSNRKCGYIDKSGNLAIKMKFDSCWSFSEGLAGVGIDNKLGYINLKGEIIIKPELRWYPQYFQEGVVPIELLGKNKIWKKGYADRKGNIQLLEGVTFVDNFSEGLALVMKSGLYGYIDKNYRFVINPKFDKASAFSEGLASVKDKSSKASYYIGKKGQKMIEREGYSFSDGLAMVSVDGKNGFINTKGEIVIPANYNDYSVQHFYNGLAGVLVMGKWGFMNKSGEIVILPQFDEIDNFSKDGIAAVRIKDKWGFINKKGETISAFKFDSALWFDSGVGRVIIKEKKGYVNKYGEYIWRPTR